MASASRALRASRDVSQRKSGRNVESKTALSNPAVPFIPELDEPDTNLRRIAEMECQRSRYAAEAERFRALRDDAIDDASRNLSLRRIAAASRVNHTRVGQILKARDPDNGK